MNKRAQFKGAGLAIFVVIFVIVFIVMLAGFDSVDANHLGVMVRLGQITGTQEPGYQWTGLFTQVYQYDMRIRKERVEMLDDASSATDRDGQAVYGAISVNYRLKQDKAVVERLYRNVGRDKEIADKLNIQAIIKEGFKQSTVKYEAMEILQNRQEVKEAAIENIRRNFPADYFEIVDIVVEDIDFSPSFKQAIEAKKTATQNKLKEEEQVQVVMFQQQQKIEEYRAEAEKLRLQKQQITDQLNTQKMLEVWDGKLPEIIIISDDTQGLFFQLAKGDLRTDEEVAD